ncbi:MAG TPA: hypothetical protein DCP32_11890 [Anaerolineaceae bacterium]|nr:hypothetical protein [Anaerolineaceae bacterium]HBA91893.1 hypothetical protein [Anaerolineaceae bacterium]
MNSEISTFEAWCIVELFGRQQIAGRVTERTIAGQGFIQVDVPAVKDQPGFTRMFGPSSIYSIIPVTEEIASAFAARNVGAPIQPWQLSIYLMMTSFLQKRRSNVLLSINTISETIR